MKEAKHDESKENFQIERLTFFTDGVFAIAITLLIIEIKIPVVTIYNDHSLWENLSETLFKFEGFTISFIIIGHFWSVHHRIFGYIRKYTSILYWINLAFLFTIVTIPFTSGLVGEYSEHSNMFIPYIIYSINMCLTGFMNCFLWYYVSDPNRDLLTRRIANSRIKLGVYRSLVIPLVFLVSMVVSFFFPVFSRFILLLIPIILHWGMSKLEKRAGMDEVIVNI
ncbi:MAG: TMEM175 family protein [Saprospiraceae bacterium]